MDGHRLASCLLLALLASVSLVHAAETLVAQDIVLTLKDDDGSVLEEFALGAGGSPIEQELRLTEGRSVKVDFVASTSAGPVVPEQAMLRWDSEASPVGTAVFAAAAAEGSGLSVTVKGSALASLVPNGPASLSLVLGDAGVARGADVLLARSAHLATATPREELLPARRERPDVHHTFRQPEKRVNALFPLLGVAAAVGLGAVALRAPARSLLDPATLSGVTATRVAFFSALTATMALLAVFWLRLTLTQTLVPLAALLSVVSITGRGLGPAKAKSL